MQSDDDCSERGIAFDASFFIFYSISGKQKSQGGFAEVLFILPDSYVEPVQSLFVTGNFNLHIAKPVQKEYHCMYICLDSPGNSR